MACRPTCRRGAWLRSPLAIPVTAGCADERQDQRRGHLQAGGFEDVMTLYRAISSRTPSPIDPPKLLNDPLLTRAGGRDALHWRRLRKVFRHYISHQNIAGGVVVDVTEDEVLRIPAARCKPRTLLLDGKESRKDR